MSQQILVPVEQPDKIKRVQELAVRYSEILYSDESLQELLRIETEVQQIEQEPSSLLSVLLSAGRENLKLYLNACKKRAEEPNNDVTKRLEVKLPPVVLGIIDLIASTFRHKIDVVYSRLSTENESDCFILLVALHRFGSEAEVAMDDLVKIAEKSDNPMLGGQALSIIADCGRAARLHIPRLAARYENVDSSVRCWILRIVGNADADDQLGFPLLLAGIKDQDWPVRMTAADVLGSVNAADEVHVRLALEALTEALGDEEKIVRDCAIISIDQLKGNLGQK